MTELKNWSLNNLSLDILSVNAPPLSSSFWKQKNSERPGFKYNSTTVTVPCVFARYIGVDGDLNSYLESIVEIDEFFQVCEPLYIRCDRGLDTRVPIYLKDRLQELWEQQDKGFWKDQNELKLFLSLKGVLESFHDPKQQKCVLEQFNIVFYQYIDDVEKENEKDVRELVFTLVFWLLHYVEPVYKEYDYQGNAPKVLFFGEINTLQAMCLILAHRIGFDVLYISGLWDNVFSRIDPDDKYSSFIEYNRKLKLERFPQKKLKKSQSTLANDVSASLETTLHSGESFFYKPWQFKDYEVDSFLIRGTLEETSLLLNTEVKYREGWQVQQNKVVIPHFFAKVRGTDPGIKTYFERLYQLQDQDNSLLYINEALVSRIPNLEEEFQDVFQNAKLDKNALLKAPYWRYHQLPDWVQKHIVTTLSKMMSLQGIKEMDLSLRETRVKIFSVVLNMDAPILQLLQSFDYTAKNPKLIVYINGDVVAFTLEDAIILHFLTYTGVDIFVYNPSGQNDIEIFLEDELFTTYHLEKMTFNLPFKKRSFWKRLFQGSKS